MFASGNTTGMMRLRKSAFAAHVGKGVWHCFGCGAGGNALDLWQAWTQRPLYEAVIDLYAKLGREIPTQKETPMPGP